MTDGPSRVRAYDWTFRRDPSRADALLATAGTAFCPLPVLFIDTDDGDVDSHVRSVSANSFAWMMTPLVFRCSPSKVTHHA